VIVLRVEWNLRKISFISWFLLLFPLLNSPLTVIVRLGWNNSKFKCTSGLRNIIIFNVLADKLKDKEIDCPGVTSNFIPINVKIKSRSVVEYIKSVFKDYYKSRNIVNRLTFVLLKSSNLNVEVKPQDVKLDRVFLYSDAYSHIGKDLSYALRQRLRTLICDYVKHYG